MTNELDTASIQSQLNESLFKAIDSLKMPFCDEECQKNQAVGALQNKVTQARRTKQSADSNLADAEKNYYVALEGDQAFTASKNKALLKRADATAKKEHDSLRAKLSALQPSIQAIKTMKNIEDHVGSVQAVYHDELRSRENSISDAETEILISQRKAETNVETMNWIQRSMKGWMAYAYFILVSILLIRVAFTGAYRTPRGIVMSLVAIALPFLTARMARFLQMYTPFGHETTERLKYLYTNGLQKTA